MGLACSRQRFRFRFCCTHRGQRGPRGSPGYHDVSHQPTHSRSWVQGTDSVESTGPTASVSTSPSSPAPQTMTQFSDRISTRTRRRSETAACKAPPAVDYSFRARWSPSAIFQTSYNPTASLTAAAGSARRRDPCSCRLAGPHGAASVRPPPRRASGTPLLRLAPSPGGMPTASTWSDALGDAAELRFAYSVARYSHVGWK